MGYFDRTEKLIGAEKMAALKAAHVMVFGLGGVGGHAAEALVRSGIGKITLVDGDIVNETNVNRQVIALQSTIGRKKVDVMAERMLDIHPLCQVIKKDLFYLPEHADEIDFSDADYLVDAIDTVTAKIDLVMKAKTYQIPIISAMGTGNKMNPQDLEVADLFETSVCPLCKVMRHELKERGIEKLKVVYSREIPCTNERPPASNAFVPASAGLLIASEVIKDLISDEAMLREERIL